MDICVIPARMGSSRFPNKPMAKILGLPLIGHVALRCKLEPIFDRVIVATCDEEIFEYCNAIGVEAVMTSDKHERASDRVQEAVVYIETLEKFKATTVVMVQGDEPMVTPTMLKQALKAFKDNDVKVVNIRSKIETVEEFESTNCVKVVTDLNGNALYFSRSPLPNASKFCSKMPIAYKQVCVIPFERSYLDTYSETPPTYLEEVESIDMNRVLENGEKIFCVEVNEPSYPVDVPEDIIRVESYLKRDPLLNSYALVNCK
jgi:3-deoxy-manno-octulosonate cytidylyltransferase (CMP-KDO synthetase)